MFDVQGDILFLLDDEVFFELDFDLFDVSFVEDVCDNERSALLVHQILGGFKHFLDIGETVETLNGQNKVKLSFLKFLLAQ